MGPTDGVFAGEASLEAAREAFREWDIHEVFGGYMAVPAGTPVVRSTTLDGVTLKLRRLAAELEDEK